MRHVTESDIQRWEPVVAAIRAVEEAVRVAQAEAATAWAAGPMDTEDTAIYLLHQEHLDRLGHFYRAIEAHWAGPGATSNSVSLSAAARQKIIELSRPKTMTESWRYSSTDEVIDRTRFDRGTGLPEVEKLKVARNWRRHADRVIRQTREELALLNEGVEVWEGHFGTTFPGPSYTETLRAQLAQWIEHAATWDRKRYDNGQLRPGQE